MRNRNASWSGDGAGAPPEGDSLDAAPLRCAVELTTDPDGVVVTLEGELDLATAPELDRQLDRLHIRGVKRVLLDLRGVSFMDSTGLSSIVRASQYAESNGHRLVLRRGPGQVQRLFDLTGVESRLTFEEP